MRVRKQSRLRYCVNASESDSGNEEAIGGLAKKEEKRAADKEKVKEDAEQAHVEFQGLVDGYFNEHQSQASAEYEASISRLRELHLIQTRIEVHLFEKERKVRNDCLKAEQSDREDKLREQYLAEAEAMLAILEASITESERK